MYNTYYDLYYTYCCIMYYLSLVYIDGNALDTILTALNKCNIDFPHEYRRG